MGRVFNFKLDHFVSKQGNCMAHKQPLLELKTRPRFCPVSWSFSMIKVIYSQNNIGGLWAVFIRKRQYNDDYNIHLHEMHWWGFCDYFGGIISGYFCYFRSFFIISGYFCYFRSFFIISGYFKLFSAIYFRSSQVISGHFKSFPVILG